MSTNSAKRTPINMQKMRLEKNVPQSHCKIKLRQVCLQNNSSTKTFDILDYLDKRKL